MQNFHTESITWTEWLAGEGADADDVTKLAALREHIFAAARYYTQMGSIEPSWADKKLASLGIVDRITTVNYYSLNMPVTATLTVGVSAGSRAEALAEFAKKIESANRYNHTMGATGVAGLGEPVFTEGPEDRTEDVDPDAPTTVTATLEKLREIILLAVVAGPRVCVMGANDALDSFGLEHVPPRQNYEVTRQADATMSTIVTAYDEASAVRVAGWRWENKMAEFKATEAAATTALTAVSRES